MRLRPYCAGEAASARRHPTNRQLSAARKVADRIATRPRSLIGPGAYELVTTRAQLDAWIGSLRTAATDFVRHRNDWPRSDAGRNRRRVVRSRTQAGSLRSTGARYPARRSNSTATRCSPHSRPLLEDPERPKLGQHVKYDINVLSNYGIVVPASRTTPCLNPTCCTRPRIGTTWTRCARRHLDYDTIHYADVAGKGAKQIPFSQVDVERACRLRGRGCRHHLAPAPCAVAAVGALTEARCVYRDIEMPLVPVLARMEQRGVLIDVAALRCQSQRTARAHAGNDQQRPTGIAGRISVSIRRSNCRRCCSTNCSCRCAVKTPTGQPSTNEEALEAIADEHPNCRG